MILRFLFFLFLFYIGYRLVFNLILPVYRTTRKLKRGIREMQERMEANGSGVQATEASRGVPVGKRSGEDYIEFEEVK